MSDCLHHAIFQIHITIVLKQHQKELLPPLITELLEKLTGSQLLNFKEPEGSLLYSQVPATCPYPEPDLSSPCPHIPFLKIFLNTTL
jgi:hypothetical protein